MGAQQPCLDKTLHNFGQENLGNALVLGNLFGRLLGSALSRGYIQHGPDSIFGAPAYKWHSATLGIIKTYLVIFIQHLTLFVKIGSLKSFLKGVQRVNVPQPLLDMFRLKLYYFRAYKAIFLNLLLAKLESHPRRG
jgi:hypothetical protein